MAHYSRDYRTGVGEPAGAQRTTGTTSEGIRLAGTPDAIRTAIGIVAMAGDGAGPSGAGTGPITSRASAVIRAALSGVEATTAEATISGIAPIAVTDPTTATGATACGRDGTGWRGVSAGRSAAAMIASGEEARATLVVKIQRGPPIGPRRPDQPRKSSEEQGHGHHSLPPIH